MNYILSQLFILVLSSVTSSKYIDTLMLVFYKSF